MVKKKPSENNLSYSNIYIMPTHWSYILIFSVLVDTEAEKWPITGTSTKSYQKTGRDRGECSF